MRQDNVVAQTSDREYTTLGPLTVRIETHRRYSRRDEDVEGDVLAALDLAGHETLLDVGCGTGSFVERVLAGGHVGRVVGLDLSAAAFEAVSAIPGVEAVHASADAIPLPAGSVDIVTARHMLYHCVSPADVVRDSRRVLAADGVFVATVNHPETVPMIRHIITTELLMLGVRVPQITNPVTTDTIADLVGVAFEDVRVVRHDNELVFVSPEPLLTFAESLFTLYGIGEDHVDRGELTGRVSRRVVDWFTEHDEPWLEPKGYSVCVARGRR